MNLGIPSGLEILSLSNFTTSNVFPTQFTLQINPVVRHSVCYNSAALSSNQDEIIISTFAIKYFNSDGLFVYLFRLFPTHRYHSVRNIRKKHDVLPHQWQVPPFLRPPIQRLCLLFSRPQAIPLFKAYWLGMDGWMNGVLGHFYALSRLNWATYWLGTSFRHDPNCCGTPFQF